MSAAKCGFGWAFDALFEPGVSASLVIQEFNSDFRRQYAARRQPVFLGFRGGVRIPGRGKFIKMEVYQGILCISGAELTDPTEFSGGGKCISLSYLTNLVAGGKINRLRRASRGTPALYEYASLPLSIRKAWELIHGDPTRQPVKAKLIDFVHHDPDAYAYYSDVVLPTGDLLLSADAGAVAKYTTNASVLNGIKDYIASKLKARGFVGKRTTKKELWEAISAAISDQEFRREWNHTLPVFPAKLRARYEEYEKEGYLSLVHKGFGNDNKRKVTDRIERLLCAIYTLPNKPFGCEVWDMYRLFMRGTVEIYDKESGELYDRNEFLKNGAPMELSPATVRRYLNMPHNRAAVDKRRNDSLYYDRVHRPHVSRYQAKFSLSKLTADDRDLPTLDKNGNRVKAYYVYDIHSGAVVGAAYSRRKDDALFLECLRDMFRNIYRAGLPMPAEIELEHHIASDFRDELEVMFPFVQWCRPGNARQKIAERLHGVKKYTVERRNHPNIGRWWARSEAYLTKRQRDSENDELLEKRGEYDKIVAEDRFDVLQYNYELHSNKKTYAGRSRWEVLTECYNRELPMPSPALIARCIGDRTVTSIRNNQYVVVAGKSFMLPTPKVMERVESNNYKVDAYMLPEEDGTVNEVYLYQGGNFLCTCGPKGEFNAARVEQTAEDVEIMNRQLGYMSEFDGDVRERLSKIGRVGIIRHEEMQAMEEVDPVEVEIRDIAEEMPEAVFDPESDLEAARQKAINNLSKISNYGTAL